MEKPPGINPHFKKLKILFSISFFQIIMAQNHYIKIILFTVLNHSIIQANFLYLKYKFNKKDANNSF